MLLTLVGRVDETKVVVGLTKSGGKATVYSTHVGGGGCNLSSSWSISIRIRSFPSRKTSILVRIVLDYVVVAGTSKIRRRSHGIYQLIG